MPAFIFLNGGVFLVALAVAARLGLQGPARALGTLAGFLVLIHSNVLLAGLLGFLTAGGLAVLVGAEVGVVGVAWAARALGVRHAPAAMPGEAGFTPAALFTPLAAMATGIAWAWPHLREATRLWVWDDYTYHMVYPALWLRDQVIAAAPPEHAFTMQAWYPLSASVVATWFMVPFAHAREEALAWVSLTALLYAGLVAAGVAALGRRLGCRRGAWAVPVVLFATSARTTIMASSFSDADVAQASCLFAALVFSIPSGDAEDARAFWVDAGHAGLLSGLALGVKVSAAAPALIVLLAMVLRARALGAAGGPRFRAMGGVALTFAVSWTATCGYWYARNLIHTGNPVYPAAFLGRPGATFPETTLLEYGRQYGVSRTVTDALGC